MSDNNLNEKKILKQDESGDEYLVNTFDMLNLKEDLLRGIYAYGFEVPSSIQQRATKAIIVGRDVIAQAQSGTGKTATFSIAILQRIDTSLNDCQVGFNRKKRGFLTTEKVNRF